MYVCVINRVKMYVCVCEKCVEIFLEAVLENLLVNFLSFGETLRRLHMAPRVSIEIKPTI